MTMTLSSPEFHAGSRLPVRFTCEGADVSPPLAWSGVPAGTRSLALVCADPDAPSGTWYHWAIYGLAPEIAGLAAGQHAGHSFHEAVNDFGRPGYGGACPPHGHGLHHYRFRLYALGVEHLDLAARPRCRDVEHAAETHALARADLVATYSR